MDIQQLQKIKDGVNYWQSKYKQAEASDRSTIDEYLYAKEQYQRAKEKLNNFKKK